MAKEMMIIFVYDTEMVQKEEDDPASAILYFHPTWVSDQQKAALCGQLMGTIQCLKNIFATPRIVSLQSGKFFITENGRYLLAIGTDRNIDDWLLERRSNTLYSLVNFFHKDFVSLAEIYRNSESLSAKMYHLFETYLKMLFFGGNLFSHIPSISLPKSASNVFTEAIHVLECCQELNNVLGGCMLYHNKVVATQLSPDLTKRLVLTDPYRIKCPAETTEVDFDLPLGVQLLQVYVTNKEYCSLLETSIRNRSIFQYLSNKSIKKAPVKVPQPDPIISAMKRDQSLIFTTVPEEGCDHSTPPHTFIPTAKKTRPKFLNLKCISIESNVEMKPINKPSAVTTPFCGQTSVCSTPMTDLKKFVHQNPLSICLNNTDEGVDDGDVEKSPDKALKINLLSDSEKWEDFMRKFVPYLIPSNIYGCKKFSSSSNLNEAAKFDSLDSDRCPNIVVGLKNKCKTITDPTFPVLKLDGSTVSHPLYANFLAMHVQKIESDLIDSNSNKVDVKDQNPFAGFDSCMQQPKYIKDTAVDVVEQPQSKLPPPVPNRLNQEKRKSLTLPLKSLSIESADQVCSPVINNRKYSSGVQLTPLMSKLSMLAAFDERSSGFGSRETTPCDYRGLTPTQPNFSFSCNKYLLSKDWKNAKNADDDSLQKCVLFVCGQQDVVMLLLLKEECCNTPEVVNKLWELCTEELGRIEKQLRYCMELQPGGIVHESEPYSYLCLDSEWDTVQRGGPWGSSDQGALSCLHRDFNDVNNLTEILIRGSDSVIYGYHCGQTEVFYHESASTNAGLPTPADLMGLVQLKAKRRLERDHAIILL